LSFSTFSHPGQKRHDFYKTQRNLPRAEARASWRDRERRCSQIAICTTIGAWASRKNKALVERNRRALAALRADGTTVRFRHVRAHAGHGMNERADRLAAQVTQCAHEGMRSRDTHLSTFRPTEVGRRGHGSGVYAPPGGPGDLPVDSVPD